MQIKVTSWILDSLADIDICDRSGLQSLWLIRATVDAGLNLAVLNYLLPLLKIDRNSLKIIVGAMHFLKEIYISQTL